MVTLVNRAMVTTSTAGTGVITLGAAVGSYQTFADAGVLNADVVRYTIEDGSDWEIGTGTYSTSGTTLSRTVVTSSNADSAIALSGQAVVFVTAAAEDLLDLDTVTDIASVKALDQGAATTDTPTFAGVTLTNSLHVDNTTDVGFNAGDEVVLATFEGDAPNPRIFDVSLIRTLSGETNWNHTAIRLESNVGGNSDGQQWIELRNGSAVGDNAIAFGEGDGFAGQWAVIKNGNLGINVAEPTQKLDIVGNIAVTGTVDGRNVSVDGTKLDTAVLDTDTTTSGMSFVLDEDDMVSNLATKVPTQQSVKAYVDGAVASSVTFKGGYDAATNTPNLDSTPTTVAIGDMYVVEVAGTFYATALAIGDTLYANAVNPTTVGGWAIVSKDLDAAAIKTSYESNANTNAYTDAEVSKLGGIELLADVTDTTNVVAALTAGTNVTISAGGTVASTDTTYMSGDFDHDALANYVAAQHIDWSLTNAANIHPDNYTDTTYAVGNGGLTEINFTSADNTKLDAINQGVATTNTPTFSGINLDANGGTYASAQLTGTLGAFIDLRGSNENDYDARLIYVEGSRLDLITLVDEPINLKHADSTKLSTTSTGIDVTGNLGVTGTVDGVDIAEAIPSTLGSAYQVLTVNAGGTAGEWAATYRTRAAMVTAIAASAPLVEAQVYTLDGLSYMAVSGVTDITDLPGLIPVGNITPSHFGNIDGVSDHLLIRAAEAFVNGQGGGIVYLGNKHYVGSDRATANLTNVWFFGEGPEATSFTITGDQSATWPVGVGGMLSGVTVDAADLQTTGAVIRYSVNCIVRDTVAQNGYTAYGPNGSGASNSAFYNLKAKDCLSRGFQLDNVGNYNTVYGLHVENCANSVVRIGYGCHGNKFFGVYGTGPNTGGVAVWIAQGSYDNLVSGLTLESPTGSTQPAIQFDSNAYRNTVENFHITGHSRIAEFDGLALNATAATLGDPVGSLVEGNTRHNTVRNGVAIGLTSAPASGDRPTHYAFNWSSDGTYDAKENTVENVYVEAFYGVFKNGVADGLSVAAGESTMKDIRSSDIGAGGIMKGMKSPSDRVYIRRVEGFPLSATVSESIAIDSTGLKTVAPAHGLGWTPRLSDCTVRFVRETAVSDVRFDTLHMPVITSTTATVRCDITTASATGSATALLDVDIHHREDTTFPLASVTV